jgi:hypothetical protein
MPNPKVKPIEDAKANIEAAASVVGGKYARGIDTGKPWKANAESDAAESLYAAATQEAIAARRRQRAISQLSEEDWKGPARQKGAQNIGPAMRMSKDKWAKNTQPYLQAIASVNMAERTTDAMSNIDGRLKPIVQALIDKKKELKG